MQPHSTSILKLVQRTARCTAVLILSHFVFGQMNEGSPSQKALPHRNGSGDLSDLAKGNLDLVAASSIQIREILLKHPGLLVELERWVAKEATDNGQVLRES